MKSEVLRQIQQVLAVASFTLREALRQKTFWITNGIFVVVLVLVFAFLPNFASNDLDFSSSDLVDREVAELYETGDEKFGGTCYVAGAHAALPGAVTVLEHEFSDVRWLATPEERDAALADVEQSSSSALLEISGEDGAIPRITVTSRGVFSSFSTDSAVEALEQLYRRVRFEQLGFDAPETAQILSTKLPQTRISVGEENIGNFITGLIFVFVMFFTIYVYGYGVAISVASEKSTRVMETLIVSARPTRILLGKCLGMGVLGLLQQASILLITALGTTLTVRKAPFLQTMLPDITLGKALLLLLYFILGYTLFSMINSMCGAAVTKMEDMQSAMMPAALISVFSFYGGYATAGFRNFGSGVANSIGMLIPFTAPYAAPSAILTSDIQPALLLSSLALLLVSIVIVSWISARIYTASVLHYGERLKFRDLKRMLKK